MMKSILAHVLLFLGLALANPHGRRVLKFSREQNTGFVLPPAEFLFAVDPNCCSVPYKEGDQYQVSCTREEFYRLIYCSVYYSEFTGRLDLDPEVELEFLALRERLEPLKTTSYVKSLCAKVMGISCADCQQIISKWYTEFRNLLVLRYDFCFTDAEKVGPWQGFKLKKDTSQIFIKCDEIDSSKLFEWKLSLESVLNVELLYSIDLYGPLYLVGPVDSIFNSLNTFQFGNNFKACN